MRNSPPCVHPIISYILHMVNIFSEISMILLAVVSLLNLPYGEMGLLDYAVLVAAALCLVSFALVFVAKGMGRKNAAKKD